MKTAVAILNWNGLALLQEFLPAVLRHTQHVAEVVVIDNASEDGSVDWIATHYPTVTIVNNPSNAGFSGGYNLGLKRIDADLFVLLNSDVQVTEGWLSPLIAVFSDPVVVAAQPKVKSFHDKASFEYAGAAGGFIDSNGYIFCRGRMFDAFERDEGQYDSDGEIFWATGACLAVRAADYWRVGGLDEDFFAHMEEIDLCWRLKNTGRRIMYCSGSTVFHVGGGTLNKLSPQKTYLNFRNNLYLLLKNYRSGNVYGKLVHRMLLDGLAALKFLFEGKPRHFWAVLRAHCRFYLNFPRFRKKRSQLASTLSNLNRSGTYRKSVVWQYFVKGKRKYSELNPEDFI